jgi:hypothetical protein
MKSKLILILVIQFINFCASFDKFQNFREPKTSENHRRSANVDDAVCDRHLSAFSDALSKRKMWALESKTISNSDLELNLKLFQCSTLGLRSIPDTCHQLERTSATGILIDVWNSDTKFQALT